MAEIDEYVQSDAPIYSETYKGVRVDYFSYSAPGDYTVIYTYDGEPCFMPLASLELAQEDARWQIDGHKVTEADIAAAQQAIETSTRRH